MSASTFAVTVQPASHMRGRVRPPGDKSISHRYAMLASIADGPSRIYGYSTGADCGSTLNCLRALGVPIEQVKRDRQTGIELEVLGLQVGGLQPPKTVLDAGNSGSTMRMLTGILAAHPFRTTMTGDSSLRRRPMKRVITPLERMGAKITAEDGKPPLTIVGTDHLKGIDYQTEVPSAQVKSAVLFAGVHADGITRVVEPISTRDHTERALEAFGVQVLRAGTAVAVRGGQRLIGGSFHVPGDISSAAFWMVAAAALPGSDVTIENVGLNPSRTGIIPVLQRMGAQVTTTVAHAQNGEPIGVIHVRHANLGSTEIMPEDVPGVIDELPVLAALATHGGELSVTGAEELRVKESDRISALAEGLRVMGADVEEQQDGFHVRGRNRLRGGEVDAKNDHRLAMAFAIAALGATGPTVIHDAGSAGVSYPEFFTVLEQLRA
jgi:3-phosphoshikimate 1-carboxyvinyltransferase